MRQITIFFTKGTIFCLLGYACLFFLFNYTLTGHDDEKYLIKKFLKNKTQIEAIAIGTSHIWAVNFKNLGIPGIELGMGGRDLAECKYVLNFLINQNNNNIKKVFVSISYFSLYQDNNPLEGDVTDNRIAMYNNMPSWRIMEGDTKNFIIGKLFPFIQSDHWRHIAIKLYKKKWKIKEIFHGTSKAFAGGAEDFDEKERLPIEEVKARVNKQHDVHERGKKNSAYDTKDYNLNILKQIILMLKKKGIEPIFITPPYYFQYTALYEKQYIKEMKAEMKRLVNEFNITYLDFSMDPDFIYEAKYFQDADHINAEASLLLGKKIKRLLTP